MWYIRAETNIDIEGPFDGSGLMTSEENNFDYYIFSARDTTKKENIGYILFQTPKKADPNNISYSLQITVAPEYRKKGIATRLYAAVDNWIANNRKGKLMPKAYNELAEGSKHIWDKRLGYKKSSKMQHKIAGDYAESSIYGYWLLADGELLAVHVELGHIGTLKQIGLNTNSDAFRKNMIRLVTENNELWVQFEWVKPNQKQKSKLISMAKEYNFDRFIVDSDYLELDRYEFDSNIEFNKIIRSIQ